MHGAWDEEPLVAIIRGGYALEARGEDGIDIHQLCACGEVADEDVVIGSFIETASGNDHGMAKAVVRKGVALRASAGASALKVVLLKGAALRLTAGGDDQALAVGAPAKVREGRQ